MLRLRLGPPPAARRRPTPVPVPVPGSAFPHRERPSPRVLRSVVALLIPQQIDGEGDGSAGVAGVAGGWALDDRLEEDELPALVGAHGLAPQEAASSDGSAF